MIEEVVVRPLSVDDARRDDLVNGLVGVVGKDECKYGQPCGKQGRADFPLRPEIRGRCWRNLSNGSGDVSPLFPSVSHSI